MSSNKCTYCDSRFACEDVYDLTCPNCEKVVEKLDKETLSWLMLIIDTKIDKALSSHTDRYNHESNSSGYY